MRNRVVLPLTLVCACLLFAPRTRADAAANARKLIQSAYDKENASMAKKDLAGAFSSVVPDFVMSDRQGHQAFLRDLKPQMQAVFQNSASIKATTVIQKFVFKGNIATVTTKNQTILNLKALNGGKPSVGVVDSVEEDLWVKNLGKWVRRTATMLSQTMTKDGKPFKAGG